MGRGERCACDTIRRDKRKLGLRCAPGIREHAAWEMFDAEGKLMERIRRPSPSHRWCVASPPRELPAGRTRGRGFRRARAAFTLVELLVVIAIIAVLIGL